MKWLPLRMNFLPLIFQEINFVTEEYISLLNKLRQREKDKPKEEKDELIQEKSINEKQSKYQNYPKMRNNYNNRSKYQDNTYRR